LVKFILFEKQLLLTRVGKGSEKTKKKKNALGEQFPVAPDSFKERTQGGKGRKNSVVQLNRRKEKSEEIDAAKGPFPL